MSRRSWAIRSRWLGCSGRRNSFSLCEEASTPRVIRLMWGGSFPTGREAIRHCRSPRATPKRMTACEVRSVSQPYSGPGQRGARRSFELEGSGSVPSATQRRLYVLHARPLSSGRKPLNRASRSGPHWSRNTGLTRARSSSFAAVSSARSSQPAPVHGSGAAGEAVVERRVRAGQARIGGLAVHGGVDVDDLLRLRADHPRQLDAAVEGEQGGGEAVRAVGGVAEARQAEGLPGLPGGEQSVDPAEVGEQGAAGVPYLFGAQLP